MVGQTMAGDAPRASRQLSVESFVNAVDYRSHRLRVVLRALSGATVACPQKPVAASGLAG